MILVVIFNVLTAGFDRSPAGLWMEEVPGVVLMGDIERPSSYKSLFQEVPEMSGAPGLDYDIEWRGFYDFKVCTVDKLKVYRCEHG